MSVRVHMWALRDFPFTRSYLGMYFWVRVWVSYSIFVRESSNLSLGSLDICPIHHDIHSFMWLVSMLWCGSTNTHIFSLFFLIDFILLLLSTLLYSLILYFLIPLDIGFGFSIHMLLFILRILMFIPLSSSFMWESLGPSLMRFSMHCILCIKGMGIVSLGLFEPSFLSFLLPYYLSLHYVSCLKTTLRLWLHTLCLTTHTWMILEFGWRFLLETWWMRSYDMIYTKAYPSYQWWIFGMMWSTLRHTPLIDDKIFEMMSHIKA